MKKIKTWSSIGLIVFLLVVMGLSVRNVRERQKLGIGASGQEFSRDGFVSNSGWVISNSDQSLNKVEFGPSLGSDLFATGTSTDQISDELKKSGVTSGLKLTCNSTTSSLVLKRSLSETMGMVKIYFYDDGLAKKGIQFGVYRGNHDYGVVVGRRSSRFSGSEYYYNLLNVVPGSNPKQYTTTLINSHILSTKGWHLLELRTSPLGGYAVIDKVNLTYLPAENGIVPWNKNLTSFNEIEIACPWKGEGSTQYFALMTGNYWDQMPDDVNQRVKAIMVRYLNTTSIPETNSSMDYDKIPTQITDNRQRTAAGRAMAYAYLYKQEQDSNLKNRYKDEALRAIKYATPKNCVLNPVNPVASTETVDSSGIVNSYMAIAGWIMWRDLDAQTQSLLKCTLYNAANYLWVRKPNDGFVGRSGADRNAFTAGFMAVMSQMFLKSDYTATVESDHWLISAFCMAYHSKTTSDLGPDNYKNPTTSYPNRFAPGCGVKTKTLYDGNETTFSGISIPGQIFKYRQDNHGYGPSGTYTLAGNIGSLGLGAAAYLRLTPGRAAQKIPLIFRYTDTVKLNVSLMDIYNAFKNRGFVDLSTGRYTGNVGLLKDVLRDDRQCEWIKMQDVINIIADSTKRNEIYQWCLGFNEIAYSGKDESWNGSERNYDAFAYAGILAGDGFKDLKEATKFTWYMKPDYLVFPNKSSGLWTRFRSLVPPSSPPYVAGPVMFYSWRSIMNEAALEQLTIAAILTDANFSFPLPVN